MRPMDEIDGKNAFRELMRKLRAAESLKRKQAPPRGPVPDPRQRWLNPESAAIYLDMTDEELRGHRRRGHHIEGVHFHKPAGERTIRYDRVALDKWVQQRRSASTKTEKKNVTKEDLREHLEKCIAQKMPG